MSAAGLTLDRRDQPLDAVLRPMHDAWVREAEAFLHPAESTEADFWTRWGAVRYLSDDFRGHYRLERRLLEELRAFLPPEVSDRLARQSERVALEQLELDRLGRRRGTGEEVAGRTRSLLEQLRLWLAEIEGAVTGIYPGDLPEQATSLLALLQGTAAAAR
jgi:hypothetical protein